MRQVQGQLEQPLSHRRQSTSHASEGHSTVNTPRHGSFMAPPSPFDGAHTARCPAGASISTADMHEQGMQRCPQRCESAPPPLAHSTCSHATGAAQSTTSSQIYETERSSHYAKLQQQGGLYSQAGAHGRARLSVHVPRGRLATQSRVPEDPCRRSTSLPPARGDAHPGDASPLCNTVSASQAAHAPPPAADGVDTGPQQQVRTSLNCTAPHVNLYVG